MKMRMTLLVLAGVLLFGASASAITNGQPDGDNHPYVGLMVALDEDGVPLWRCSGSLLSTTVFLTAAHCTEAPAAQVEVWFDEGPVPFDPDYLAALEADEDGVVSCNDSEDFDGYPCQGDADGTPHPNPDWCPSCAPGLVGFSHRDVGVVVFTSPLSTSVVSEYANLPSAGLVDTLPNKTTADFVGYGVQVQAKIPGSLVPKPPPFFRWTGPRIRLHATGELISGNFKLSGEFIRFSLSPGGGSGGTCFGDSGGPDLLGGTNTVLAVNSFVTNFNCSGVGYSQRVDIPEVLAWITSFMD